MKRVVSNKEVVKLWWYQAQDQARNGKRSLFFRDRTLYSYGTHWPIARIDASGLIIFNDGHYGVTTRQHANLARSEAGWNTDHIVEFTSPNKPLSEGYLAYYIVKINELITRYKTRRRDHTRAYDLDEIDRYKRYYNQVSRALGLGERFSGGESYDCFMLQVRLEGGLR